MAVEEPKVLWWQAPTLLNPHFATGSKDQDGSRIFYEPLASWDPDGNLVATLAAELPSLDNGGLAEDGKSVTCKLKQGVAWHDGRQFTADDVVFNWEYAGQERATITIGSLQDIAKVETVDQDTVASTVQRAAAVLVHAFAGPSRLIIPKHLFESISGSELPRGTGQHTPVGTGPVQVQRLQAGRPGHRRDEPALPRAEPAIFRAIEMKGGGDAVPAARAVLQTGEYDCGWNATGVNRGALFFAECQGKRRSADLVQAGIDLNHGPPKLFDRRCQWDERPPHAVRGVVGVPLVVGEVDAWVVDPNDHRRCRRPWCRRRTSRTGSGLRQGRPPACSRRRVAGHRTSPPCRRPPPTRRASVGSLREPRFHWPYAARLPIDWLHRLLPAFFHNRVPSNADQLLRL